MYRELLQGKDAHVGAIHAGLECGLLGEKFPGMDMVRNDLGWGSGHILHRA